MANTIRIRRSTGSSAPTTAENAELAFSEGNKILWYGIGTAGAGGTATSLVAIGGSGAFVALDGSLAQTITGVKTFSGATVLGTPGSGTLTNCTALPLTTGITGVLGVANGGTGFSTLASAGIALRGANSDITSLTGLTTPLTVGQGGTGSATLAGAGIATLASPTFTGTLGCAALTSSGNVIIGGNLTVNGTTVTVNSTVTTIDDPILTLGGDTAPSSDDGKDRGIEFRWHNGTLAKLGFFGFDDSTGYLTFIPDATNTTEVFSGTAGDIQATNFRGALIGNASTATNVAYSGLTGTVPTWNQNTTGNAATATTATTATNVAYSGLTGTVPTWNQNTTGNAATVTTNANLTGAITSSGNTTSLGTASFSSASLAGALTDKTGTGVAVFATSPNVTSLTTTSLIATGTVSITGGVLTTSAASATLFNSNATTLNVGNAATTLVFGATSGSASIRNGALQLGNTTATLTTSSGTTNSLTINPYGSLIMSPIRNDTGLGGTQTQLIITNTHDSLGAVSVTGGDLVLGTKSSDGFTANPVNIIFEGATNNVYDTTLTVVDPTANRTITLPDATDTLVGKATTDTLTNKTLTTPKIAQINDTNGLAVLKTGTTASAVNEVTITNNIATQAPHVSATGTDTNISLHLAPKGTGSYVVVENGTDGTKQIAIGVAGAATATTTYLNAAQTTNRTITLPDATGTVALTTNLSQFAATTSAQLAGIMSDETGSGSLVFANTPTLIAPLLGTPTSGILTNCTGTASGLTAGLVTNGLYTTSTIDGGSY